MKTILVFVAIALAAFGASAAASWILVGPEGPLAALLGNPQAGETGGEAADGQTSAHETASHAADDTAGGAAHAGGHVLPRDNRRPSLGARLVDHTPGGGHGPASGAMPDEPAIPAAVRPAYVAGVDDVLQLASSSRDRLEAIRQREAQLAAREAQMELVFQDLRSEHAAMEALRSEVSKEVAELETQLSALQNQHSDLQTQEQNLDEHRTAMQGEERANIKKMASVYDSMAPESAAKIFSQMVASGGTDTAVKLLSMMKERQAAKVLAEMSDPAMAAELSEKLRSLKHPAADAAAAAAE